VGVVNKPFKYHLKQSYCEWLLTRNHILIELKQCRSVELLCHGFKARATDVSRNDIEIYKVLYVMKFMTNKMRGH
jgi:hypothetical protein